MNESPAPVVSATADFVTTHAGANVTSHGPTAAAAASPASIKYTV